MKALSLLPACRVYIGALALATLACQGSDSQPDRFAAPDNSGATSMMSADVTLNYADSNDLGAAARAAGAAQSADLTLVLSDPATQEIVWSTTQVGLPLAGIAIQVPVGVQGIFHYSAVVEADDGTRFVTADELTDSQGQPLFTDTPEQLIELAYGQHSQMSLQVYEHVSVSGAVELNTDLSVSLHLTEEQQAMVAALDSAVGRAYISGCPAYGATLTATTSYDAESGLFTWPDLGSFLIVGEACTLNVEIEEASAPRLRGEAHFSAPGNGGTYHLEMDLEVVDAYIDAFIDVQGMLADVTFAFDDTLQAYLDQGHWSGELTYSLTADNGVDAALVSEMVRQNDLVLGSLFPLNHDAPVYVLTLTIWDGGTIVLQGSDVVDFSSVDSAHITLSYELGVEIEAGNLTNVYFHAWLDDNAEQTSGVHVDVAITSAEGVASTQACDTGNDGSYTCMMRLPMGATVQPTYSYPGYLEEAADAFVINTLSSISLPYTRLYPEGCEHGFPGDTEVCDGFDNDCDGLSDEGLDQTYYADSDGDGYGHASITLASCAAPAGYVADASDCDDTNAAANPGGDEACDGMDNDCDGATDEGVTSSFYLDLDSDGHGDASNSIAACEAPVGYAANADDCDDSQADAHPGAAEVCDDGAARDNDCDGQTDEGVTSPWYADADGDSYGDPNAVAEACTQPDGYEANSDDCDDTRGDVHPGAAEICDGLDQDCDGNIDENLLGTYYADADADGHGDASSPTEACGVPAGHVSSSDDCDDTSAAISPEGVEVCNGIDDNCDGTVDEGVKTFFYLDADGDTHGDAGSTKKACELPAGYAATSDDCDDSNAAANPGAAEACNGVDDDCDASTDEGVKTIFYSDTDSDGYGDINATKAACQAPAGRVANSDDCDDTRADVSPAATEVCDTVDNNCDGQIDEDLTTLFYADADADGFGNPANFVDECVAPNGYLLDNTDCDDTRATVNPGAPEVCDLLDLDEDCDGAAEDADAQGATGKTAWWVDNDSDGYGGHATSVQACDDPTAGATTYSAESTDCQDNNPAVNPGAQEVCGDGIDNNCDAKTCLNGTISLSASSAKLVGESSVDRLGQDVASGDFNGDGYSDLLISGYRHSQAGNNSGSVYVIYGPVTGTVDMADADAELLGAAAGDYAGQAIANAGDVNGDGIDDILIGAPYNDGVDTNTGAAYLFYGPVSGVISMTNADAVVRGDAFDDRLGWAVSSAGDVNGDGFADVVLGATMSDLSFVNAGAAYLFYGPLSGSLMAGAADARFYGDNAGDQLGFAVSRAGDVNGDGFGDFLIGANNDDEGGANAGAAYLVHGPVTGLVDLSTTVKLVGAEAGDYSGRALDGGVDVNGDGYDDLLVGAFYVAEGLSEEDIAYLIYGPVSASMNLADADIVFTGDSSFQKNKIDVAFAGDVNGDGKQDILLGSHHEDTGDFTGSAYLFTDLDRTVMNVTRDAQVRLIGEAVRDYAGASVAAAGDVDGDGSGDFIVGAWGHDMGGSDAGAAYLILGGL